MNINGFPQMPVVKLTDEQIAAGKAGGAKIKEMIDSGQIDMTLPAKPILTPGVIYHPNQPSQPSDPTPVPGTTPMVAIDTPLTYDAHGLVVLKPQG
ncbi:hypothetical protein ACXR0M_26860 [Pseudomonas sp. Eth.TT006]